ncbi:MAG: uroporphyrinogen decarboxylase family protein [Muricomes sp.]|uniref:uroporphyrinogen decarboxylase family protein n=1 Tax=Faecalicatena contorta TaxID=39482 RepID=UPI002ECB5E38|nr:uroporphyrinogen decarboxylase family protein [Muricomes sp.]
MNSKERVRAAFEHKTPDRVPATMQAVETAWEKMQQYFQVESAEEVMDILEIDTRVMDFPPYIGPKKPDFVNAKGEVVHTHPFGQQYVEKWNGVEYNSHTIKRPLEHVETMEELMAFRDWPNPDHFDYEAVKRFCGRHQDKAIRIGWPGPYQVFLDLYPAESFYMLMAEEPEMVKAMLNRYSQFYMEMYERMLEAGDGAIDLIRPCDDYGTQISLLFSPKMWDEYFAENTKKLVQLAHKYNCFYLQHSCGAVRKIIPNLIACGVDGLEPIQKVKGMEVDSLKREYGDMLCFQGGVDTQNLLPFGTPEEVRAETEYIIRTMNVDGGYILGPSQDFEGDVPVENIIALYEARKKFI